MNDLKKYLGIVWMLLAPTALIFMVMSAFQNINSIHKGDISNPIPWIIIITVFTPIAVGLFIFGYYCFSGEYASKKKTGH